MSLRAAAIGGPDRLGRLRPLLGEVNDRKRIRVAGASGSLASLGCARARVAPVADDDPRPAPAARRRGGGR